MATAAYLSPDPTASSRPPWILLDAHAHIGDGEGPNDDGAEGLTSNNKYIKVSVCPALPPAPSRLLVHCPDAVFCEHPHILCTADGYLLLRVCISSPAMTWSDYGDYFIYHSSKSDRPSLRLLPKPPSFDDDVVGILPGAGVDHFTIAALPFTGYGFDLHLFRSECWAWTSFSKVPIVTPQEPFPIEIPRKAVRLYDHMTTTVITLGGEAGTMGWVDLYSGILFCNLCSSSPPVLRCVPLPLPRALIINHQQGRLHDTEIEGCPKSCRGIAVVQGRLRMIELDVDTTGPPMHDPETGLIDFRVDNWELSTYTNSEITGAWEDWKLERTVKASDLDIDQAMRRQLLQSGLLLRRTNEGTERKLENLQTFQPALSLDDKGVVYLLTKVKFLQDEAWVLAVDVNANKIQALAEFGIDRSMGLNLAYCPSRISSYMNAWPTPGKQNPATTAATAPRSSAMMAVMYGVKTIEYGGHSRIVLYPFHAHQCCALLALGNALLLRGAMRLSIQPGDTVVPLQQLILALIQHYRKQHKKLGGDDVITKAQMEATIKLLSQPIDINFDFTKIAGIRSKTVGLKVFEHLEISLYHTWIVEPQDTAVASFVADNPFTQHPIPEDADKSVVDFFGSNGLTTFGLQSLSDSTINGQIYAIVWNTSFHVVVKNNDVLYVLQNNLDRNNIWKELTIRDDGRLCNYDFTPVEVQNTAATTSLEVQTHKCSTPNCQFEFVSLVNLNRHKQNHLNVEKDFVRKAAIATYWDQLTVEEAHDILFIKPMQIKGISGSLLYRLIEKTKPKDRFYSILSKIKVIVDSPNKISANELFAMLSEASEDTTFSSDIHCYPDYLFDQGISLLSEASNIPACYSFFIEMSVIERWLSYKREVEALTSANNLLQEDSIRMCRVSGCMTQFCSDINFNRHQQVHSKGSSSDLDILFNRDDISNFWDNLTANDARLILCVSETSIQGFRGRKLMSLLKDPDQNSPIADIAGRLNAIIISTEKTTASELFDVLDQASEGTLFCTDIMRGFRDSAIFEGHKYSHSPSLSNVLGCVSYIIERRLVQKWFDVNDAKARKVERHIVDEDTQQEISDAQIAVCVGETERSDFDTSKVGSVPKSHDGNDTKPGQRILFEDFVRENKLTKIYNLPQGSLFKILKKRHAQILKQQTRSSGPLNKPFKLSLNVLTSAGRNLARGFMTYIIMNHRNNICWNGKWDVSDMEVSNGEFVITKEPLFDLTSDGIAEDFKKYFDLVLQPHFYNSDLDTYPLYFHELREDTMKIPDPKDDHDGFIKYEMYLALHFAFMPPLSRSTLLLHLYKAYASQPFVMVHEFRPLSAAMEIDWRRYIANLPILSEVYHGKHGERYNLSYYHLLRFARNFISLDMEYTKVESHQLIDDMAVSDLILSQLLPRPLTTLVLFVLQSNMERRFFGIFQALEASDGKVFLFEEDDMDDTPEDSPDDWSDEEQQELLMPPSLATPPEYASVGSKIFPAFVKLLNSKDPSDDSEKAVLDELRALDEHLEAHGPYINGENISAADDMLGPKLFHLQVALEHLKGWKIPKNLTNVHAYTEALFSCESFVKAMPAKEHVVALWAPMVNA